MWGIFEEHNTFISEEISHCTKYLIIYSFKVKIILTTATKNLCIFNRLRLNKNTFQDNRIIMSRMTKGEIIMLLMII